MRKVYRVVRYLGTEVKWEDSLSLPQEWADRIAQRCERKSEGYILNDNILTELLGQSLSDSDRFSLLALLACVWQRQRIVFFI